MYHHSFIDISSTPTSSLRFEWFSLPLLSRSLDSVSILRTRKELQKFLLQTAKWSGIMIEHPKVFQKIPMQDLNVCCFTGLCEKAKELQTDLSIIKNLNLLSRIKTTILDNIKNQILDISRIEHLKHVTTNCFCWLLLVLLLWVCSTNTLLFHFRTITLH